jgi:hypothetical protein
MSALRIDCLAVAVALLALPAAGLDDPDTHEVITSITLPDAEQTSPVKATSAAQAASPAGSPAGPQMGPVPKVLTPPRDIQVGTLGSSEGPTVGLIEGADDLWSGSGRGDIEILLKAALTTTDPPLRDLSRRLILAKAASPTGQGKRAIVTLRIEKLLQAGLIEEAGSLAAQADVPNDADFSRVQADALLYAGRGEEVCSERTASRLTSGDTFWIELRAYCAAVGGDTALADLTRAVLQAQGGDPAFDALLDGVIDGKAQAPGKIVRPTALHVFLLRRAGLPVTGEIAAKGGTPENLFAVRDARNAPSVRLAAAERIVGRGAISPIELRALSDAQIWPAGNLEEGIEKMPFLVAQARLRRAAQTESQPARRMALLAAALSIAEKKGYFPLVATVNADLLVALPPASGPDAPLVVRSLLLADADKAAAAWKIAGEPLRAAALLLAGGADAKLQKMLGQFAETLSAKPDPKAPLDPDRDAKAQVLCVAAALDRMPPDVRKKAEAISQNRWAGKRPADEAMRKIEQTAQTVGRRGEAVLRIVGAVRSIGWRDLSPESGAEFVHLVKSFGFDEAAKAMAREALLLYVPPPPVPAPVTPR